MPRAAVTDENLRLIYSKNHEPWLHDQIGATKRQIFRHAVILLLGTFWMLGYYFYSTSGHAGRLACVTLEGDTTLEQVIRDGLVPRGTQECEESAVDDRDDELSLGDIVAFLFLLFVLLMMMVAVAEGIRSYYRHRGYRRDLRDHLAFLDKYNRADSPVAGLG